MIATRILLALTLMLSMASGVFAQETTPTGATTAAETSTAETTTEGRTDVTEEQPGQDMEAEVEHSAYRVRTDLSRIVRRHPSDLGMVLALDPSLLANEQFLANYPDVAEFVAAHPEIRRTPRFYVAEFAAPQVGSNDTTLEQIMEGLLVFSIVAFIAFVLSWLVRTVIEQRRWNRLSRTQTEVHSKILDRFGSSEELLQYIRSPAGAKFLESAPIPLHHEQPAQNAPLSRILWSVQLGVVVAVSALGVILVSFGLDKETSQGLFALGVIALSVGVGFIASAAVSVTLSRRLSAWQPPEAPANLDDAGHVR